MFPQAGGEGRAGLGRRFPSWCWVQTPCLSWVLGCKGLGCSPAPSSGSSYHLQATSACSHWHGHLSRATSARSPLYGHICLINPCLVSSAWPPLLGHLCLDSSKWSPQQGHLWSLLPGPNCLTTSAWSHQQGHPCLVTVAWPALPGHIWGDICLATQVPGPPSGKV